MINGNLAGILGALKWPGAVVGGVGALAIIASAFGFSIEGPGQALESHKQEHVIAEDVHAIKHEAINDTLSEIDDHLEMQQILIEGLVAGECLESKYEKLGRQGILDTCKNLGIERQTGDAIDQQLESN